MDSCFLCKKIKNNQHPMCCDECLKMGLYAFCNKLQNKLENSNDIRHKAILDMSLSVHEKRMEALVKRGKLLEKADRERQERIKNQSNDKE